MGTFKISLSRHSLHLWAYLSLFSCLWLCSSCQDERDETSFHGRSVGFVVTAVNDATDKGSLVGTRSAAPDTLPKVEITELESTRSAEGQALYLHTLTENGIHANGVETNGEETTSADATITRGTPVTTATMHPTATAFAALYPATDTWNGSVAPAYFHDTEIKASDNWSTTYHWPGFQKRLAFFAYAPHHCAGVTLTSGITTPGAPVFTYTVPADVANQTDLLTASNTNVAGDLFTAAPLAFRHALTAIRFETGSGLVPGTVTKITLKGVYGTGKHRIGDTNWSEHSNVRNFVQTLAVTTPDPNVIGTSITQPAQTFMMIPQTLPTGAQIEVVYTDKLTNTQRTLTASIAGKTWSMGKTVTYRISTNSISVTPKFVITPPEEFTYTGGNKPYTVMSYLEVTRAGEPTKTVIIPWTVEYSTDNGSSWSDTKPAWLTAFTENGVGNTSPVTLTATVAAQEDSYVNPHTTALKAASPKTNWNLSNAVDGGDAVLNTANCYLVNAPGTYRLPLVYGNAIKGGNPNSSAYISTTSGSNVLRKFINHRGVAITDPYIYNNAHCTPANCTLVWQDELNLVTNVALSGDFLTFTVNQSTIRQGNAVVAVRDASNTVLWSWHIWLTDYELGTGLKTITNHQNQDYTILPVNVGWCDGIEKVYAERTVQVRFKQLPTAGYTPTVSQTITVKQNAHNISFIGNNTYFQYGRKDPFVGGILDGSTIKSKTWYDANGNVKINQNPPLGNFSTGNDCIMSGIKGPGTFCTNNVMDNTYANLWSADNTVFTENDNPVTKTIYDPSPEGYKLPPSNVFTGFTTTGSDTSTPSQFNVSGAWDNGWNFYCNSGKTETVFFPAPGGRYSSSGLPRMIGSGGFYWAATPSSASYGRYLDFYSHRVYPLYKYHRSYGFSVRPCRE